MWFKAKGTVIFDPKAGKAANQWWCILECPIDILDYYRHWIEKEAGAKIGKPLFGSHISIIRGEEPVPEFHEEWGFCYGEEIEFEYEHKPENAGEYWWVAVKSPRLGEIRKQFGLSEQPLHGFHLTIGRENK